MAIRSTTKISHEGEDHPDQERHQCGDRQRVQPGLLHVIDERGEAHLARVDHVAGDPRQHRAEQAHHLDQRRPGVHDAAPQAVEPDHEAVARLMRRRFLRQRLLDRLEQRRLALAEPLDADLRALGPEPGAQRRDRPGAGRVEGFDARPVDDDFARAMHLGHPLGHARREVGEAQVADERDPCAAGRPVDRHHRR
jgi:hypothetical protein